MGLLFRLSLYFLTVVKFHLFIKSKATHAHTRVNRNKVASGNYVKQISNKNKGTTSHNIKKNVR